jgi:hypothetical protein
MSPSCPTIPFGFIILLVYISVLLIFARSILSITALSIAAAAAVCPLVALVPSYHLGFRYSAYLHFAIFCCLSVLSSDVFV